MVENWLKMSACEVGRSIGRQEIDPVDLAEAFFEAINDHPASSSIYSALTVDRAMSEAAEASARAKAGMRLSPLDGVPISWKDLYDSAGTPTEAGSALLSGRTPTSDAEVLRRATAAGLVCLGKTHLSELAFSGLGINPVTATPPCVNDPAGAPGGSSSGSAASVAFGLASATIGSDTGGSVRIPAAWNDLVGLKTTSGLLPLDGVVPLCPSFDSVGPLTRTVEDASGLLAVLDARPQADLEGATLSGCRFLLLESVALDDIQEAPAASFCRAVEQVETAGAMIEARRIPAVEEAITLAGCLYCVEAYAIWMDEIEAAPELMFASVRERFRAGEGFSGTDFVRAWRKLDELRTGFRSETAGFDAVILPTSPILPPDTKRALADEDYYVQQNLLALRNTRIANLMEAPALTLPAGLPSTGIMLIGQPFRESRLLRTGQAVMDAMA